MSLYSESLLEENEDLKKSNNALIDKINLN